MRTWMQPSPKCPYGVPRRPCCGEQRAEVPQVRRRAGRAAPRSPPSRARPRCRPASGSPCRAASSRIRHSARCPAGSVTTVCVDGRRRPRTIASARARGLAPASRRPSPRTARRRPGAARPRRAAPGRRPCPRRSAGRAAAGRPRPRRPRSRRRSRARPARARAGASTSRTVASVSTPRVPSLPQKARAHVRAAARAAARPARSRRYGAAARGSRCAAAPARPSTRRAAQPVRQPPAHPCAEPQPLARRAVTTSSSRTLSAVVPQATECEPQELLPIMPPRVQRLWVEGSGPKRQAVRGGGVPQLVQDDARAGRRRYGPRGRATRCGSCAG